MPAQRILPSDAELIRMVEQGLTQAQIARKIEEEVKRPISRSAVSVALSRAGLSRPRVPRAELLPPGVREEHAAMYPARMLRAESRLRADEYLSDAEKHRLDTWKANLEARGDAVTYHRCRRHTCGSDSPEQTGHAEGWFYIPRNPGDDIFVDGESIAAA